MKRGIDQMFYMCDDLLNNLLALELLVNTDKRRRFDKEI